MEKITAFLGDNETKRIHFATTHSAALKPMISGVSKIILPFNETIGPIMSHTFGTRANSYLFESKYYNGYWRGKIEEIEFERCRQFIEEYNQIVFLRDTLDLSLALSMNMLDDESRTEIGELEYLAKFQSNEDAEKSLVELVQIWLNKLPYYNVADTICAMPCSNPQTLGLPRRIVDRIEKYENISNAVVWKNKDRSLKELHSVDEKLDALQEFGLEISSDLKGKNVILLDDLYMSGVSMQFVALKLKEAGAYRVFGISIVKSRSNTAL